MATISPCKLRRFLYGAGLVLLLTCYTAAALIWRAEASASPDGPMAPLDSRQATRQIEVYYGQSGVLMEEAEEWLHGRGLAELLVVASSVGAIICFVVASKIRR